MNKFEKIFCGLLIGSVLPITGFLAGWWSLTQSTNNLIIGVAAFGGLGLGLLMDTFFLKKWVANAYRMSPTILMAIYLFYSICVFGFFMGVPVFNVILALPAGLFIGASLAHLNLNPIEEKKKVHQTLTFTLLVMGFICAASAFLALRDPTTAANLEGMLRLRFTVTQPMIVALILVGGSALLLLQWGLGAWSIRWGKKIVAISQINQ
ncbi:hypothetical protein SDC9_60600 [bioreactor metagenome]|uniref:Uncharacterized protein n=1 Tax=bioreactor metagenome TaxID=1076179 RepID=A0A644XDR7_9ZZZZ